MRKSTLLWLALAAFCGVALFHTSQDVHDSREKLAGLNRDIAREEESLRVLQAEWSYLNQPPRLEKLAKQYLKLAPQKGAQFIRAEDIGMRSVSAIAPPPENVSTEIKDTRHPGLVPGSKSASARLIDSRDGQTASWMPEQVRHDKNAPVRKFGDVMKSLGVER